MRGHWRLLLLLLLDQTQGANIASDLAHHFTDSVVPGRAAPSSDTDQGMISLHLSWDRPHRHRGHKESSSHTGMRKRAEGQPRPEEKPGQVALSARPLRLGSCSKRGVPFHGII